MRITIASGSEDTIEAGRAPAGPFRLVTKNLDPAEAPAIELAAAYTQRWEIETSFDELKTHQRGPGRAALQVTLPPAVGAALMAVSTVVVALNAQLLRLIRFARN